MQTKYTDERIPRALIEFPHDLDGPPVFYPIADTDEECEAIRRMFSAWNAWVVRSKAIAMAKVRP